MWFPIAAERWFDNDVQAAVHWMDRWCRSTDQRARPWPDRLRPADAGPAGAGAAGGRRHGGRVVLLDHASSLTLAVLPLLHVELGVAQTWLGDLAEAEVNLTGRSGSAASGLPAYATWR